MALLMLKKFLSVTSFFPAKTIKFFSLQYFNVDASTSESQIVSLMKSCYLDLIADIFYISNRIGQVPQRHFCLNISNTY